MNVGAGFAYALTAAFLWGILPAFLLVCLQTLDSSTITWYRYVVAGVAVFLWLAYKRGLPTFRHGQVGLLPLVFIAAVALVVNYVANVLGLEMVSAETAQVVMQLAPFMLMLGGVLVFNERMSRMEWGGVALLIIGLALFFNTRLVTLFNQVGEYTTGVLIYVLAAACWAIYALLQKVLFKGYTAGQLTMLMYLIGALLLVPFSTPSAIGTASTTQLLALLFCCMNTLVAYGAFTKALNIWHASKVGAVLAVTPIFTFLSMVVARWLAPDTFLSDELNELAYLGACIVVAGSMIAALGKGTPKPANGGVDEKA